MYIVRRQDMFHPRGGASYLIRASSSYGSKYRTSKIAKRSANMFRSRVSAQRWATRIGGVVVEMPQ